MLAPVSAPSAPPTYAPLRPSTPCPMAAPMAPPTMAPATGSPAEAGIDIVAAPSDVARAAMTRGFFNMLLLLFLDAPGNRPPAPASGSVARSAHRARFLIRI